MKILKELKTSVLAVVVLTLLVGVAYPLVVTGFAQVAFNDKANGSKVKGGSSLIAQKPQRGDFWPRPSATGYSATATFFANRGPNSDAARHFYRQQLAAY